MTQSSPGIWVSDPKSYQKKLLDLLGSRDPFDVLSSTPDVVARFVRENSAAKMRTRPFSGKWTPNEIIGHFVDTEIVYGFRVRLIFCEDNPTILGMDQDKWVAAQRHNDREPSELLEMFRTLRKYNLGIWRLMKPADYERTGQHNERGKESLGLMLRMEAGHDLSHIDQITRYLAAIG